MGAGGVGSYTRGVRGGVWSNNFLELFHQESLDIICPHARDFFGILAYFCVFFFANFNKRYRHIF